MINKHSFDYPKYTNSYNYNASTYIGGIAQAESITIDKALEIL